MTVKRVVLFMVLTVLCAVPAHAGLIYSLTGFGSSSLPLSFVLAVPTAVNPQLNTGFSYFACSQLLASTNCQANLGPPLGAVTFSNQSTSPRDFTATITFSATDGSTYVFFFPTGAFASAGTFISDTSGGSGNAGTLFVSPEPSSLIEVAGALGLVFCVIRSRKLRKRPA